MIRKKESTFFMTNHMARKKDPSHVIPLASRMGRTREFHFDPLLWMKKNNKS